MGIKRFKPTTPSLRQMRVLVSDEVTSNNVEKSLLAPLNSKVT